jgi:hypothetical protein
VDSEYSRGREETDPYPGPPFFRVIDRDGVSFPQVGFWRQNGVTLPARSSCGYVRASSDASKERSIALTTQTDGADDE